MRPRILDLYLAGRFAAIYAASLASFTLIYVLVDSVAQFGAINDKTEGFLEFLGAWLRFYGAQVPILFCRVLNAVTLAASAAFTVTLIHRANEFTPVMAAGISLRRLLAPIVALAALASLTSAAVQETWIPYRRDEIREARALGRGKASYRHAKFFDARRRLLVGFESFDLKRREQRGYGMLVLPLTGYTGKPFLLEAESASWEEAKGRPGRWILRGAIYQEYDRQGDVVPQAAGEGEPPLLLRHYDRVPLSQLVETDMIPQDLEERESQEPYLWFGELWRKAFLAGDSPRWRIRLYGRLADPFHGLILVLLGIPVILARGSRNIFLSAIATVVLSALYFVSYTVLVNLGNRGTISPGMAVGLAPVLFGSLGLTLYTKN